MSKKTYIELSVVNLGEKPKLGKNQNILERYRFSQKYITDFALLKENQLKAVKVTFY